MTLAVEQARLGLSHGEVPVGCVIVITESDEVIARSHNLTVKTRNATTHCEVNCIRELAARLTTKEEGSSSAAEKVLRKCTLYVTVEPCIMCAQALNLAGVQRVVYGCDNDKFGGAGSILSLNLLSGY